MQSYQIYKNLAWLNELPVSEAESIFRGCCDSHLWAKHMANSRPFPMLDALFEKAETLWFSLSPTDHLEALADSAEISDGISVQIGKSSATEVRITAAEQWKITEMRMKELLERTL